MTILKHILSELTFNGTVAIVGSSGRLLGSSLGETIDAHDEVVRFNRASCEGYRHDVGSKTTLRVANNHVFANVDISDWAPGQPKNFIRDLRNQRILLVSPDIFPWTRRGEHLDPSCLSYLFKYEDMATLKKTVGFNGSKNLSVGLTFICLCVDSEIVPDVYGFDFEQNIPRTHYWEPHPGSGGVHEVNEEKKLLINLAKSGKIILHK